MTLKNVKPSLNKIAKSLENIQDSREFLLKNTREIMNTNGISGLYAINQEPNSPAKNRVPKTSVNPTNKPPAIAP